MHRHIDTLPRTNASLSAGHTSDDAPGSKASTKIFDYGENDKTQHVQYGGRGGGAGEFHSAMYSSLHRNGDPPTISHHSNDARPRAGSQAHAPAVYVRSAVGFVEREHLDVFTVTDPKPALTIGTTTCIFG
jgi:hypothetical protein